MANSTDTVQRKATGGRSSALAWWSAATILVSAFLLFQVQPVISKKILPWFGGSPAVWTTAMLFFQIVLLGGYAYAHLLIRFVPAAKQGLIHGLLLVVGLVSLPITPGDFWKPSDGSLPALRILLLLLAKVGPTYFLLAATGPLVQAWFSRAYPGRSPYRLYALSNVGSLAALLSYPFVFEILLTVNNQGRLWSLGFVGFAVLIGGLAWAMWRLANEASPAPRTGTEPYPTLAVDQTAGAEPPSLWLCAAWAGLAALASMALLAITNHVCQDIAVVPFMWVVPLSLYLLSFIICFDSERWYIRKLWGGLAVCGIVALTSVNNGDTVRYELDRLRTPRTIVYPDPAPVHAPISVPIQEFLRNTVAPALAPAAKWTWDRIVPTSLTGWYNDNLVAQAIAYITVLFLICMVCHGELVKFKPAPSYLTLFYLTISAGGALGGILVALVCPLVFKTHFELALAVITGFVVGWIALANDGRQTWLKGRELAQWAAAFLIVGGVLLVAKGNIEGLDDGTITVRNFYGTLSLKMQEDYEDPSASGRALYHGRILHGFQYRDPIESGNRVVAWLPGAKQPQTLEVVSLKDGMAELKDSDGKIYSGVSEWDLDRADAPAGSREMEPTTYYLPASGAGLAVEQFPRLEGQGRRIAVIGLGTGTMAAYGKPGDLIRFYDIDPKVLAISERYFSFRTKSQAQIEIVLGDARVRMEREPDQNYDVIVLDAFSGDAIPAHLLTVEAMEVYLRHLRKNMLGQPTGIIAVHISNRYLDLKPVVAAIARAHDLPAKIVHLEEGFATVDAGSDWVLLTRNQEFWHNATVEMLAEPLQLDEGSQELLWTDQRSSLLPLLDKDNKEFFKGLWRAFGGGSKAK